MRTSDPDFAALKDLARLRYLLNFEAIATVANDEEALPPEDPPAS